MKIALALSLCLLASVAHADLYIAPDGKGNDADSGSRLKPVATLKKALELAAESGETKLVLLPGVHFAPEGVVLDQKLSGRTITGSEPGKVTLVGGVPIDGWSKSGSDWVAQLPAGTEKAAVALFEDGQRLTLARFPNTGYLKTASPVPGKPRTAFVTRPGDLPEFSPEDVRALYWPQHDWFTADKPLTGYNKATRTVTLQGDEGYDISAGNRYYLYNADAFLDQPGEATLHKGVARVRPHSGMLGNIWAATAPALIHIDGAKNVHIEGLILSGSAGSVVQIDGGASETVLRECRIENGQADGVHIGPEASKNTLYGCKIQENGAMGVSLVGKGPQKEETCFGNVVESCKILHCGRLQGHGYGIEINHAGKNRIEHNEIAYMPRYGVSIKGIRFHAIDLKTVPGLTWENRYSYFPARENRIAYNNIHHVNEDSQDTGAIEAWGPGRDNVIERNWIHDSGNKDHDLESGIYLDDGADYFTVVGNVVHDIVGADGSQPVFAKGIGNRFEGNLFVVHPSNESAIRTFAMAEEPAEDHVYRKNVVAFDPAGQGQKAAGAWGRGIGNLQAVGKTLTWNVDVPVDGEYRVYLYYAADNKPFGNDKMDGRTTLSVDGGAAVPLTNLPDTGGWDKYAFSPKPSAILSLKKGQRTIVWKNEKGGGLNWDAFVLTTFINFQPTVSDMPNAITVQAETAREETSSGQLRYIYKFENWTDKRFKDSNGNLFFSPDGEIGVRGGPGEGPFSVWQKALGGKYDGSSRIADPLFVNQAGRDFRLKTGSPALGLGFNPLDVRTTGVKPDWEPWLDKAAEKTSH
ncbi:MAG: right-handed parallel beta-helix repeat-containing protein [Armatimonas sp.]